MCCDHSSELHNAIGNMNHVKWTAPRCESGAHVIDCLAHMCDRCDSRSVIFSNDGNYVTICNSSIANPYEMQIWLPEIST